MRSCAEVALSDRLLLLRAPPISSLVDVDVALSVGLAPVQEEGVDAEAVNALDAYGWTPLFWAVDAGNVDASTQRSSSDASVTAAGSSLR